MSQASTPTGGDPWAPLTPAEQARLRRNSRPSRVWPPVNPGPIVGDIVSDEQARQIADYEAWRDADLR